MLACQAKPPLLSTICNSGLFRPHRLVAAGAAGRRDHRRLAGIRRRRTHFGIDACGRAQHAVGLRELLAERRPMPPMGHFSLIRYRKS